MRRIFLKLMVVAGLLVGTTGTSVIALPAQPAAAQSSVKCHDQSWAWQTVCSKTVKRTPTSWEAAQCKTARDAQRSLSGTSSVTGAIQQAAGVFGFVVSKIGSTIYYYQKLMIGSYLGYNEYRYCNPTKTVSCSTTLYRTCTPR